jgi:uncharacterized membrane protein YqjE
MENQQNLSTVKHQPVIKTTDWFITLLVAAIPLVGIIMLFVWAFGSSTNLNKSNWAKALLLWYLILFVFYLLISLIFGATFLSTVDNF